MHEFRNASSVLIGTHLNPDGDALGSALAASLFLDGLGVANEVLCHHAPPKNMEFLPGISRVRQRPKEEKHDLALILDLESLERLGSTEPYFVECPRMVVIDHHLPHHSPGDLRLVDTSAAATAAILGRLLLASGEKITPEIATCLLTGIVTDTGSFRFRNTNSEALSLAASLLEVGGNINLISEEVFQKRPYSSVRLYGHMLDTMSMEANNQLCYSRIHFEDFQVTGATDEDTEGFVNELLSIDTVQIAFLAREAKPGKIRVSMRSRNNYDVAKVAQEFGGGGHRNAAGCTFEDSMEDAVAQLVPRLKACLASS
ncbi:MAG: bifunctional oligoribonuclease/PAP phosphatase NrnA [Armatimonadetes bacterium]|nr:bifunctional oligoribonuclease/PAP phosphatase NrnA [Armatimonadota bacterium]